MEGDTGGTVCPTLVPLIDAGASVSKAGHSSAQ